jgi:tetratricopeptide (TPR) repeat protein
MIDRILGHYRVVEAIGAGGMGQVYRAHDLQLDRDVALKVIPPGTLNDESTRRQFRTEALALAKLNHPNIATVHEFGSQDGVDFIAMELIPGLTLRDTLASGALPESDVIRLGLQLAEGLAAAHEHGVVHRDLKPGNLILRPDGRLKILDFGLARVTRVTHDGDVSQTQTGTIAPTGTLPYMAPEQLRSLPADARTDVYAAGAVLYEMVTGERPFPQQQVPELMGAILHQSPDPPSARHPRVASGLEQIILKALEKDPNRRFQHARELYAALEAVQAGFPPASLPRPRWWGYAAAGVALATGAVAAVMALNRAGMLEGLWPTDREISETRPARVTARQSIAVLGFKNVSGRPDDAWLSTALAEMMTTELAAGEQLRTVPGETVARAKSDLSLSDADSFGETTLSRIRTHLAADHIVLGSYIPLGGGQLRVDLRLQNTRGGDIVLATSVKGDEAAIDDLVTRAGATLRARLGVNEVSAAQGAAVRAALPRNRDAARQYSIGLDSLRAFDYLRARESLEKAVAIEPEFALAHSALAAALKGLGYDLRASEAAKRAYDLSPNFSREERLWIEGQYREMTNAWNDSVTTYGMLFDFFPDNLEYGLRLAAAQTSAGKAQDALATLSRLRASALPTADDPRIDAAEAAAAAALGDFKRQQTLSAAVARKASAQGARLLVARARVSECSALRYLGQPTQSVAQCEEARKIFAAAGDRSGVARALNAIGVAHMEQGDLAAAKSVYLEALELARQVGDRKLAAMILNNLAGALHGQVDLAGSRRMLEEAMANFHEIGDRGGVVRSLDNIGIVLMDEGQPAVARKRFEESLEICRELGNKNLLGYTLYLLGNALAAQDDLAAARRHHGDARALRMEIGDAHAIGDSDLALAILAIESGEPAAAESAAREQATAFQKLGAPDKEARSLGVLARALLAQGRNAEAGEAANRATTLMQKTQDPGVRLAVTIDAARPLAASGNRGDIKDAVAALEAAVEDAAKHGLTGAMLEARLALGQIEVASGDRSGRSRLASLERDAKARGFALIARKAAASR